ncbi:MAG TPA: hypothetical protein PLB62_08695 [Candidatus Sumerlaeota bacterium]|nr:hypothetical protein [Candidatus Sumerlaeota bacterium]
MTLIREKIEEVLGAEKQAVDLIAQAGSDREQAIHEARTKARETMETAVAQARAEAEKVKARIAAETKAEDTRLHAEADEGVKRLAGLGNKNMKAAVAFIVQELIH